MKVHFHFFRDTYWNQTRETTHFVNGLEREKVELADESIILKGRIRELERQFAKRNKDEE